MKPSPEPPAPNDEALLAQIADAAARIDAATRDRDRLIHQAMTTTTIPRGKLTAAARFPASSTSRLYQIRDAVAAQLEAHTPIADPLPGTSK